MIYECSTHGTTGEPHRILPKAHRLANVFAVGVDSPPHIKRLAEEVVGFRFGQRVTVRAGVRRYESKTGVVAVINPADHEVQIKMDGTRPLWFCPAELLPTTALQGPTGGLQAPQTLSGSPTSQEVLVNP